MDQETADRMLSKDWKGDAAKYARLSKPHESEETARVAVKAFMGEIATLREKYRIPELIIQYQVYVQIDGEEHAMHGGCGWGNQGKQAELAKRSFDLEFDSLCLLVERLAAMMPKARRELITDPLKEDDPFIPNK